MFVFLEEFFDVTRHRNVERSLDVVPVQLDAAVEIAGPVFGDAVMLFDAADKVICVFFSGVFYPKIVND